MAKHSKKNGSKSSVRFDLADIHVVYTIFFQALETQIDVEEQVMSRVVTPEEAAKQVFVLMDHLAGIFLGDDADFVPVPDWTGEPLGRSLRCQLALGLIALSDNDRELFTDDLSVVFYAIGLYMNEARDLIQNLARHDLQMTEEDARDCHELCLKWARRFVPPSRRDAVR